MALTPSSLLSRCQFAWQHAVNNRSRWLLITWLVWFSLGLRVPFLKRWLQASQKVQFIQIRYREQILSLYLRPQDVPILAELFQDETYQLPKSVQADLTGEQIVIDIGAHIGLASLYFRMQGIQGQGVAVEPSPANFTVLQQNLSSFNNIQLIQKGIGAHNTRYRLAEDTYSYNHRLQTVVDQEAPLVSTVPLEKLLAPFDRIDLLKIDMEGAEREALRNAYLWQHKVRYLWIELHAPYSLADLMHDLAIKQSQVLEQRADTVLIQL